MNYIWNHDQVQVFSVTNVRWVDEVEPWITGMGTFVGLPFSWQAKATPHGWYVEITKTTGLTGSVQGSTFNLPLEVATAARRLA